VIEESKEIEILKIVNESIKTLVKRLSEIESELKQQINYHE